MTIITELIKLQKQKGLTDSQFAESLGIHKSSWYRNKRTGVISADILLKAFDTYPELRKVFLSSIDATDRSEKRCSQILGGFRPLLDGFHMGIKNIKARLFK